MILLAITSSSLQNGVHELVVVSSLELPILYNWMDLDELNVIDLMVVTNPQSRETDPKDKERIAVSSSEQLFHIREGVSKHNEWASACFYWEMWSPDFHSLAEPWTPRHKTSMMVGSAMEYSSQKPYRIDSKSCPNNVIGNHTNFIHFLVVKPYILK